MSSLVPDRTAAPAMTIREGRIADAETIEAVHYASREAVYRGRVEQWPPPGPDQAGRIERWRAWLSDPVIVALVGEADGEIVGFSTVRPSCDEDADPEVVAEMPTLYVRPDAWHRGFGRALCAEALRRATEQGFHTLTLWVIEMNDRAREFYADFGFTPDDAIQIVDETRGRLTARRYRIEL